MSTNLDHRPAQRRAGAPGGTREPLRSIRSRLTAGSAILMLGLAALLCLYVPTRVGSAASEALGRRAQGTAALVASVLEPVIGSPDPNGVQRVLEALAADDGLVYAIVLDHGDRMLGAYDAMAADAARFRTGEDGAFEIAGVWRASSPIGQTGARLFLGYDLDLARSMAGAERGRALLVGLLVLLFGTAGIYGLAGLLTGPLRDIVRTVDRVSAGDLTARTDLRSRDELGWLGRSFDTMIARLEEAYGALQTANRDLEERVAERTRMLRREIDERRRAEDALRDSERRFRSMFESAAIGIALIDRAGTVVEGNASLACLLGMTTTDLRGTAVSSLVEEADQLSWNALFERLRSTREPVQSELRFRSTDGRTLWTRIVVSAVTPGEDEPERAIVMFDDITERKALEEQLRHSQKLEAVGRLAGGIAHDFNNLLTTINGLADVLVAEHADVPRLHNDLEEIRKAGERAAALTAQLLAFSRKQIVLPEEIDFNAAVLDMKPMLERLTGPDIQLRLELTDDLHGLRADPGQIAQVVMNLVVNARDAMPDGGQVLIRTENLRSAVIGQPPAIRITVSDTGTGMDAGTRQRIFEPFFTTKDHGKGTGLGLSTVYGIIQQAGGTIDVQSEPGRGSTFFITLPSLGRAPDQAHRSPERASATGHETILLVEDEDAVRQLVGRILRKTGYTVLESRDGWHALELFHADPARIDAVLTDVVMPDMNGPELVRRLVRVNPRLRILYMSGYTEDEALHAGLDPMATGFIQKPMSPHSLTRKLREVLDARAVA